MKIAFEVFWWVVLMVEISTLIAVGVTHLGHYCKGESFECYLYPAFIVFMFLMTLFCTLIVGVLSEMGVIKW